MATSQLRSVKHQKAAQVLGALLDQHLYNNPNSIFSDQKEITAFGEYLIKKTDQGVKVYHRKVPAVELSNLKLALSWCILHKYRIYNLVRNIQTLDDQMVRRESDIIFYNHILKHGSENELKTAVYARLLEVKDQLQHVKKQLNKCINSAKYWQQKGFDNETSRLGLQKSNREITKGF